MRTRCFILIGALSISACSRSAHAPVPTASPGTLETVPLPSPTPTVTGGTGVDGLFVNPSVAVAGVPETFNVVQTFGDETGLAAVLERWTGSAWEPKYQVVAATGRFEASWHPIADPTDVPAVGIAAGTVMTIETPPLESGFYRFTFGAAQSAVIEACECAAPEVAAVSDVGSLRVTPAMVDAETDEITFVDPEPRFPSAIRRWVTTEAIPGPHWSDPLPWPDPLSHPVFDAAALADSLARFDPGAYQFDLLLASGESGNRGTFFITRPADHVVPGRPESDCGSVPGGPDDLTAEPGWADDRQFQRWTTEHGCPVRIDVVTDSFGPSHCDMESVEFLTIGEPFGASSGDDSLGPDSRRFVWDPDGVLVASGLRPSASVDRDAALGRLTAVDTGYRRGTDELWLDVGDRTVAYIATSTQVDVLHLDEPPLELCS